jgi:formate--tetrahydrofolate ligase
MVLDPSKVADWQIAEEAEKTMKTVYRLADEYGLTKEELLPHGHYVAKIDYKLVLERLKDRPDGKCINVTAITPTPLGEGKSTSTMGLVPGLGKRGKKATAAMRQPSAAPP